MRVDCLLEQRYVKKAQRDTDRQGRATRHPNTKYVMLLFQLSALKKLSAVSEKKLAKQKTGKQTSNQLELQLPNLSTFQTEPELFILNVETSLQTLYLEL